MAKLIEISQTGGPDKLVLVEKPVAKPTGHDVLIRHTAIGLNYIDVYFRTGLYPSKTGLPFTPGLEAAGIVEAVGPDVTGFKKGDRIAYCNAMGAYADERLIDESHLVPVPDGVSDQTAAALMLKGLTAHYLMISTYKVTRDTTLLFHAAAGGVGLIAGQLANHLGATSIGTASSDAKCAIVLEAGYSHAINYETDNFVEAVNRLTDGKKCDVVYDSIGKDTFEGSLDCLKPRGMMVSFGNASGPVPPFEPAILSARGSLYFTRPSLFHYIASREELLWRAREMFSLVEQGKITITIGQTYTLETIAKAHQDLENRLTTGATIILP